MNDRSVPGTRGRQDPFAPLEEALLARARGESDAALAEAWASAARLRERAQEEAEAVTRAARARGAEDARAVLVLERSRARRAAREVVLQAQREAHEGLRSAAVAAVRALLADPREHAALVALVRERLGPAVAVREHPDGGVLGTAPDGRAVDASVPALVASALADLDLEDLWSPT